MVAGDHSEKFAQYARLRPRYSDYAYRLERLLRDLLIDADLDAIQFESRAKDLDSFVAKLELKGGKYTDPLVDMTDLAGVRVITYYLEDVDIVEALIRREFLVDDENSVDKSQQLDPDRFGYLSRHFVVSMKEPRSRLPEWAPYAQMKAEIQVRTALQHAWAAVNHKLEYKSREEVPQALKRGLGRLSALFEIADQQFSIFRQERAGVDSTYEASVREGNFNLDLDLSSLGALLERSEDALELKRAIVANEQPLIPDKDHPHTRSVLLLLLRTAGYHSVAEVNQMLAEFKSNEPLIRVARDLGVPRTPVTFSVFLANMVQIVHPIVDEIAAEFYEMPDDLADIRRALRQQESGIGDSE